MDTKLLNKTIIITVLSLLLISNYTFSDAQDKREGLLVLQVIMQEMDTNMQGITHAISYEDWAVVAETAPLIANHPKPPAKEISQILAYLGDEIAIFKGMDMKTHNSASELAISAAQHDGNKIISNFATLQQTCLACHERFRQPFQNHFYMLQN